jgi:hypothetical protein
MLRTGPVKNLALIGSNISWVSAQIASAAGLVAETNPRPGPPPHTARALPTRDAAAERLMWGKAGDPDEAA